MAESEPHGGMAERLKAAVLKTADREVRGFESLSLRHLCRCRHRVREHFNAVVYYGCRLLIIRLPTENAS